MYKTKSILDLIVHFIYYYYFFVTIWFHLVFIVFSFVYVQRTQYFSFIREVRIQCFTFLAVTKSYLTVTELRFHLLLNHAFIFVNFLWVL